MTSDQSITAFDFRTPGSLADHVEAGLASWQRTFCETVTERWSQHLSEPVQLTVGSQVVKPTVDVLQQVSPSSLVIRVALQTRSEVSLFVLPRTAMLALVQNALGSPVSDEPEDRDLTTLELSLAELLMQELVAGVGEAFPGAMALPCEFLGWEQKPHRTRLFPASEVLIVIPFEMESGETKHSGHWLIRHAVSKLLFGEGIEPIVADAEASGATLEQLALEIPFPVSIRLGSAQLKLADLASLQPGDIVMLDQPIRESLEAVISGIVRFRGRAGRCGARRAFQIEEVKQD